MSLPIGDGPLLWSVALLLWFIDGTRRVEPDDVVFLVQPWGIGTRWLRHPPGFGSRYLMLPNPVGPFAAPVLAAAGTGTGVPTDECYLARQRLLAMRMPAVMAGSVFLLLFVGVPLATWFTSTLRALLGGLGLTYLLFMLQARWLTRHGPLLGIGARARRKLLWSQILCPPNGANFARHVAAHVRLPPAGLALAARLDPGGAVHRERRLELGVAERTGGAE